VEKNNRACEHYRGDCEQCPHAGWLHKFQGAINELNHIQLEANNLITSFSMSKAKGFVERAEKCIEKWSVAIPVIDYRELVASTPKLMELELDTKPMDPWSRTERGRVDDQSRTPKNRSLQVTVAEHFGSPGDFYKDCYKFELRSRIGLTLLRFIVCCCQTEHFIRVVKSSISNSLFDYVVIREFDEIRTKYFLNDSIECEDGYKRMDAHFSPPFSYAAIPNNHDSFQPKLSEQSYYVRRLFWDNNIITSRVFGVVNLRQEEAVSLANILRGRHVYNEATGRWGEASGEFQKSLTALKKDRLTKDYIEQNTTVAFSASSSVPPLCWDYGEYIFGLASNQDMTNMEADLSNPKFFDYMEEGLFVKDINLGDGCDLGVLQVLLGSINRIKKRFSGTSINTRLELAQTPETAPAIDADGPVSEGQQGEQNGLEIEPDAILSNITDGPVAEAEDDTTEGEKQEQANNVIDKLVKEITAIDKGLTKEQIAEMVIEAMRPEHKNNQDNEGPDVGNRDCFWWQLRQKGCTQKPTQTIWNGLHVTLKERLGDNKDVTNLKNNYINTRVKAHEFKIQESSGD
jgi:hypothetical protein